MKKTWFAGIAGSLVLLGGTFAYASTTSSIIPIADGNYLQWVPSTGSTHYTLVDEAICNGRADYNSTNTVGNRDSYGIGLGQVPNAAKITQIDITPCASNNQSGGGSSTLNLFYRLNGVDSADAGAYSLTGVTPSSLATTSFSGLSTIKGSGTTLETGAVLSAGTKGARLSKIAVVVTYTALAGPSGLGATTTSSSEIDLGWTDNATFEDGFVIERRNVTASTTFAAIATTTANVISYQDTGLTASTTYGYRVHAYNAGGYSLYSNSVTATTNP